ncbi:MAG: hypothetical protein M1839_003311 [Geoglossum umbratile]|nr:MAG: hypothetical protein M1839_003311 [Geoglossum umbratile]
MTRDKKASAAKSPLPPDRASPLAPVTPMAAPEDEIKNERKSLGQGGEGPSWRNAEDNVRRHQAEHVSVEAWRRSEKRPIRHQVKNRIDTTRYRKSRSSSPPGEEILLPVGENPQPAVTAAELPQANAVLRPGTTTDLADVFSRLCAYRDSHLSSLQFGFKRGLVYFYNSEGPGGALWCPIARRYHDPLERPAVHIFPFSLGMGTVGTIFGADGIRDSVSPRSGLIMSSSLERRFERHLITLVPASKELMPDGSIKRWKIVVTDRDVEKWRFDELWCSMGDLNGVELEFKSDCRPKTQFLYFHYVIALLRARKQNHTPGWLAWAASNKFPWVVPGRYISENLLFVLVQQAGVGVWGEASAAFAGGIVPDSVPPSGEDWAVAGVLRKAGFFDGY